MAKVSLRERIVSLFNTPEKMKCQCHWALNMVVMITSLFLLLHFVFIPIINHVDTYEKIKDYDPILALSSIVGGASLFLLPFIFGEYWIVNPISRRLGWYQYRNVCNRKMEAEKK